MRHIAILLAFTGCVATSSHVEEGDKRIAKFSEKVVVICDELATKDPVLVGSAEGVRCASEELQSHANKSAGFKTPQGALDFGTGAIGLLGAFASGGIPMALLAMKKMMDTKKMTTLVKEVASMDKAESMEHVIKSKVRV